MNYYKGRNNLACTIFIPVKCGNNCPFCNTNSMYEGFELKDEYIEKILNAIDIANNSKVISEFVITGGEPLFNLEILKKIINKIEKNVYINTSLPNIPNIDECIDYVNNEDKIKGINISRHIANKHNVKVCDNEKFNNIKKYIRINCIIKEEYLNQEGLLKSFIDAYATPYIMINFRADYRYVTTDTLKNRDNIEKWLLTNYHWEYTTSCLVCNSEFFSDNDYKVICYHRGLENSRVTYGNNSYINDVLIDMYGNIYSDWDMIQDDKFIEWLKNN